MKPKSSTRQSQSRKNASSKKRVKARVDVVGLIDEAFSAKITIVENGKKQVRTVMQEIYRQLWKREIAGDLQAISVRLAYEKFVAEQSPQEEQEIIVLGGLPKRNS